MFTFNLLFGYLLGYWKPIFNWKFSTKVTCAFLLQENIKEFSEIITYKPWKQQYLPHYLSDTGFKDAIVNRAFEYLHEEGRLKLR